MSKARRSIEVVDGIPDEVRQRLKRKPAAPPSREKVKAVLTAVWRDIVKAQQKEEDRDRTEDTDT